MAHFAELDEANRVLRVVVVSNNELLDEHGNESEQKGIAFCQSLFGANTRWLQTSYNGRFRKNYAGGPGSHYDPTNDVFIPPKPYSSWVLDEASQWVSPIPHPNDGLAYLWDEAQTSWVRVFASWAPSHPDAILEVMAEAILTPSDTFMDVGCGDGRVLLAASQYTSKLIGLDVDKELLSQAAELVPQAQLLLQDVASYSFDSPMTVYSHLDHETFCYILLQITASNQPIKVLHYVLLDEPQVFPVQPSSMRKIINGWLYVWDAVASSDAVEETTP